MVCRVTRACFVLGRVAAACTSGLELGFNATAKHFDRLACLPAGPDSGLWCRTPKLTGRWRQSELSGNEYLRKPFPVRYITCGDRRSDHAFVTMPLPYHELVSYKQSATFFGQGTRKMQELRSRSLSWTTDFMALRYVACPTY